MKLANTVAFQLIFMFMANGLLASLDVCPLPQKTPARIVLEHNDPEVDFVDNDRDIKDLGTTFVVQQFFRTPDTIYNFMKLVYESLDKVLAQYRTENQLDEQALFVIFKGGNVLRMVANEIFDQLSPEAKALLKDEYFKDFKRSDADFSVFLDENRLNGKDYQATLDEIASKLFAELGKIRQEFKNDPDKYFNFSRYNPEYASKVLNKYFNDLNKLPALYDKENPKWYNAKFLQMQFLDSRANEKPDCPYIGVEDSQIAIENGQTLMLRKSEKPDWIVNTDNRILEWKLGSDPTKKTRFYLVRSKANLDYIFEQNKKIKRAVIGGELIDVSIPHREDESLRSFLDGYDKNVMNYTLIKDAEDRLNLKAYSIAYLTHDLQSILFDSFDRPWKSGLKYEKRLSRIFFLLITEMLNSYGIGGREIADYVENIKQYIIPPMDVLYPLDRESKALAKSIKRNSASLSKKFPKSKQSNEFWQTFANFIDERIVQNHKDDDQENLKAFLDLIDHNLNIAIKLSRMNPMKINLKQINEVELKNLF